MKTIGILLGLFFLIISSSANAQTTSDKVVILETQLGKIIIELYSEDAPKTVENFLKLADSGFYDGVIFHRILEGFFIHGGDPLTKQVENQGQWGTGDAGYSIQDEFNDNISKRGIVAMARTEEPNSASSQFFIIHENYIPLDKQYTIFGRIKTQESYDTLDKIASLNIAPGGLPLDIEQARILNAEVKLRSEISSGGCLIATATYGSELASQVQQLREIRDNSLLQTESGSAFMESFNQFYYSFSPSIADVERENPVFKEAVKLTITPLLSSLSLLNYVNMDSEVEVLGYGISLILLNVGMYFVAPTVVIIHLKKRFNWHLIRTKN